MNSANTCRVPVRRTRLQLPSPHVSAELLCCPILHAAPSVIAVAIFTALSIPLSGFILKRAFLTVTVSLAWAQSASPFCGNLRPMDSRLCINLKVILGDLCVCANCRAVGNF